MKIDAVVTWVDGTDPNFIKKKSTYEKKEINTHLKVEKNALLNTRFNNAGEVYYTLKLIRANMPWVDNIYLITNGQKPYFFTTDFNDIYKVSLVTHKELFRGYTQYLPTFNSRSIEAMLWNIDGLSEKFIYFNDDFFVTRPLSPSDFYLDGKIIARGGIRFKNLSLDRLYRLLFNYKVPKGLVGYRKESKNYPNILTYFSPAHAPHPLTKTNYKKAVLPFLDTIIKYKFRNIEQKWPIGLYYNYLAEKDSLNFAPYKDWDYASTQIELKKILTKFSDNVRLLCVQSLEEYSHESIENFYSFLKNITDDKK